MKRLRKVICIFSHTISTGNWFHESITLAGNLYFLLISNNFSLWPLELPFAGVMRIIISGSLLHSCDPFIHHYSVSSFLSFSQYWKLYLSQPLFVALVFSAALRAILSLFCWHFSILLVYFLKSVFQATAAYSSAAL